MNSARHSPPQALPKLRVELQRLRQSDQRFARLVEEFDGLDARLERAEGGIERLDELSLGHLKQARLQSRDELARQFRRATGQCCGCGKACGSH
ncbi:MAG TPA: DUF465 domain-containing protein [Pseudomonas sp.]|nr:DUF465 domain-containing protein [Pseudomonas sp.]